MPTHDPATEASTGLSDSPALRSDPDTWLKRGIWLCLAVAAAALISGLCGCAGPAKAATVLRTQLAADAGVVRLWPTLTPAEQLQAFRDSQADSAVAYYHLEGALPTEVDPVVRRTVEAEIAKTTPGKPPEGAE